MKLTRLAGLAAFLLVLTLAIAGFPRLHQQWLDARLREVMDSGRGSLDKNDTVRILAMLRKGANPRLRSNYGFTVLQIAAGQDALELAREALARGADPNDTDPNHAHIRGQTPLIYAVELASPEMISLLLEHGADANHRDSDGRTAMSYASDEARTRLLKKYGARH
jgi:ankyrin repeat protein